MEFCWKLNPEIGYFRNFAKRPLGFIEIDTQSIVSQRGPHNWKIIPKRSLASEKSRKMALKLQNFISFKPQLQIQWFFCQNSQNHFLFLFVHSYHTCFLHVIDWLLVFASWYIALCLNQFLRTYRTKHSRSPNFSSWINKASHLEHFTPIVILSIYSIELELHDRRVCVVLLC
jgi:hypothetical protein